jgi:hypothetical protein
MAMTKSSRAVERIRTTNSSLPILYRQWLR